MWKKKVAALTTLAVFLTGCASSPEVQPPHVAISVRQISADPLYEAQIFAPLASDYDSGASLTPDEAWKVADMEAARKCADSEMIPYSRNGGVTSDYKVSVSLIFRCLPYADKSPRAEMLRQWAAKESAERQAHAAMQSQQRPAFTSCVAIGDSLSCATN